MTTGALLQLVAYGAQDVYLSANPQVTFFKQAYKRHSNFAMESIEQVFNGVANFGKHASVTLARNGDLVSKIYLQATLPSISSNVAGPLIPSTFAWIPFVGQYLIKSVEVEIGGQLIDRHYGDWLHIWNELTLPGGKGRDYLHMVNSYGGVRIEFDGSGECVPCSAGDGSPLASVTQNQSIAIAALNGSGVDGALGAGLTIVGADVSSGNGGSTCIPENTLYVPLEFWFNRHVGLALPLIALQYHEVKLNFEFNALENLVNLDGSGAPVVLSHLQSVGLVSASLWVDYIYLDTEERRRFAQVSHEYLIEQLQFTGAETVTSSFTKLNLQLNHPVKELIWTVQNPNYVDTCHSKTNCPWRYSDATGENPVAAAKLQLNGQDRFQAREGKYFNRVQPYQHHSDSPSSGINVYSFALTPETIQPSGSLNFSRIDSAILQLWLTPSAFRTFILPITGSVIPIMDPDPTELYVRVYAVNYNVLRIMSGMGGLAYST